MSSPIIDAICREYDVCSHETMKEFLKTNEDFLERFVSVYENLLESMVEQRYLEEFEDFIIMKNKS